jgi:hypothetical protein
VTKGEHGDCLPAGHSDPTNMRSCLACSSTSCPRLCSLLPLLLPLYSASTVLRIVQLIRLLTSFRRVVNLLLRKSQVAGHFAGTGSCLLDALLRRVHSY